MHYPKQLATFGAANHHYMRFYNEILNRLVSYNRNHSSMTYDNTGNIIEKSDVGSYDYDETLPYQMNYLTTSSLMVPQRDQHIVYNALQLPDTISDGPWRATFRYYGDGSRSRMAITGATSYTEARYYGNQMTTYSRINGDIEATKDVLWLAGDAYNGSAALVRNRQTDNRWHLYYAIRDNQGSIVTVTDSAGTVRQQLRYDPWGNLMDYYGSYYAVDQQPEMLLERSYTGHEHLPQFGLINMNARLYEPATARFLSPDPEVQMPDFSQNLNRYTYCLNNPLRYIDPTGMIAFTSADTVGMTNIQKQKYLEFVQFVRENELAREICDRIENDKAFLLTFGFAELPGEEFARFDLNEMKVYYNISRFEDASSIEWYSLLEEYIHVYQRMYEIDDLDGVNTEYDAKLISQICVSSVGRGGYCTSPDYIYLNDLFNELSSNYNSVIPYSLYMNAGFDFVKFSSTKNVNAEYLKPVLRPSRLLLHFINLSIR